MSNYTPNSTGSSGYRDQFMHDMAATIQRAGFIAVGIGLGQCDVPGCHCARQTDQWIYTVGLVESGLPELVMVGAVPPDAQQLVANLARQLLAGGQLRYGEPLHDLHQPYILQPLNEQWFTHDPSRMALWVEHYGTGGHGHVPQLVQVIWADNDGRFPGDPLCARACAQSQILLADDPISFPRPFNRAQRRSRHPTRGRSSGRKS